MPSSVANNGILSLREYRILLTKYMRREDLDPKTFRDLACIMAQYMHWKTRSAVTPPEKKDLQHMVAAIERKLGKSKNSLNLQNRNRDLMTEGKRVENESAENEQKEILSA